jgi:hypothetical protein
MLQLYVYAPFIHPILKNRLGILKNIACLTYNCPNSANFIEQEPLGKARNFSLLHVWLRQLEVIFEGE